MKALSTVALLAATPAQAFCPQLTALFDGASTLTLPEPFGAKANCTTSLGLSGVTSTHCAFAFDYRSPEATEAFQAVIQAVPTCLDTAGEMESDQDVNHPDFYDLRIFQAAKGEVGVSLKDKGGLQETYVFVRVSPNT